MPRFLIKMSAQIHVKQNIKNFQQIGVMLLIFPVASSSEMTQHNAVKASFPLLAYSSCRFKGRTETCCDSVTQGQGRRLRPSVPGSSLHPIGLGGGVPSLQELETAGGREPPHPWKPVVGLKRKGRETYALKKKLYYKIIMFTRIRGKE